MNIKGMALVFMAGYFFFAVDHFHRSILNHGYHLALVALAVWVVLMITNKQKQQITQSAAAQPPLLSAEPGEDTHTINVGQTKKVKA